MFPNALICVSSFITITGTLTALIVPGEQSYPQMNASCKGTQNTCLCNIHHAQLEPILWATSGYRGYSFLCMACDYVRTSTCFLWQTQLISPSVYINTWKKTVWNKPKKGCLSPFHNIWLDWISPLVFNLQWRVILAGFNSSLTCIINLLVEMKDLDLETLLYGALALQKLSTPAWITAPNPSFEPRRRSQTISDRGKICTGI